MASYHLTLQSRNQKTGPIPVSTTAAETCAASCPFNHANQGGCYAEQGPLALFWRKVSAGTVGGTFAAFLEQVRKLPAGQLWRHNQAGDLPGAGDTIDAGELAELVEANRGKRGFTYTHKPPVGDNVTAIAAANAGGFTINLSGNNPTHADELAELAIAPVVCVLPSTVSGNAKLTTAAGRRIVVCPATYRDDTTCATCGLCQRVDRKVIVGFPAHGASKARVDAVARR